MRLLLAALIVATSPTVAPAQDQLEVLQNMLCELRELRTALLQGHVGTQFLEDNRREREMVARGLETSEDRRRQIDGQIQELTMQKTNLQESLRTLRIRRAEWSPERLQHEEQEAGKDLRNYEIALTEAQKQQSEVSAEVTTRRNRMAELENEYERLKNQIRGVVAASGTVCKSAR